MRKRSSKSKPIIEMNKQELEQCFDELGRSSAIALLEDVRAGLNQDIFLAASILTISGDPVFRMVYVVNEYGDGEGIRMVDEDIASTERLGLLNPGESLTRRVFKVVKLESDEEGIIQ